MAQYKTPHNITIAGEIKNGIRAGVPMRVIFDKIKEMPNGPRSFKTIYTLYRKEIVDARAELHTTVGSKIMEKAMEGDLQALTLVAKGRLGWNDKIQVEEVDPDSADEDTGAIDDILAMLKLKKDNSEDADE